MLEPYLDRIDQAKHYTNFGPLNKELEARHAARFGVPDGCLTTVGNATLGLALALRAMEPRQDSLCIMPAWTFVATPLAALMAGLTPYFVDVDRDTWGLDPERVMEAIATAPGKVGAIMPVLPFGRPLPAAIWDDFSDQTGVPVVIDAAAAIDTLTPVRSLSVVSLHATKLLGAGEGGVVVSTDAALVAKVRSLSAFGFRGARIAHLAGTNAKMSEYHAAVGLAALDHWPQTRQAYANLALAYTEALSNGNFARLQPGFGDSWLGPTCVASFPHEQADAAAASLAAARIETRHWWERGAHAHPATAHLPRTNLSITEHLAKSTLGLPFHLEMTQADVDQLANVLSGVVI